MAVPGQSNMEMNFDYCCNTTDSSEQVLAMIFLTIYECLM